MTKHLFIFVCSLILVSTGSVASATVRATVKSCASADPTKLAQDLLVLMRKGLYLQQGIIACTKTEGLNFTWGPEVFEKNVINRTGPQANCQAKSGYHLCLEAGDQVKLIGEPTHWVSPEGIVTPYYQARYEIVTRNSAKPIQGEFRFMTFGEEDFADEIQGVGCAELYGDPTVSFIDRTCWSK